MADSMRGSCTFFSSNTVNILVPDGGHTFMVRTVSCRLYVFIACRSSRMWHCRVKTMKKFVTMTTTMMMMRMMMKQLMKMRCRISARLMVLPMIMHPTVAHLLLFIWF